MVSNRVVGIPRTPGNLPGSALLLTNGGSFPQSRVFGNYNSQLLRTGRRTHRGSNDSSCSSEAKLFRVQLSDLEVSKVNSVEPWCG